MKNVVTVSGNNRRSAKTVGKEGDGWKMNIPVGAVVRTLHRSDWCPRREYRAGRHRFGVISLIQAEAVGGGTQGQGPGNGQMMGVSEGREPELLLGIRLAFKIIKGLNGKKDAIHRQQQGVEKHSIYPVFHLNLSNRKVGNKLLTIG